MASASAVSSRATVDYVARHTCRGNAATEGLDRGGRRRLRARQPDVVLPVAQRDATPGGAGTAGRGRHDRDGWLGQAQLVRTGPLQLRRAARLPVRAVGLA